MWKSGQVVCFIAEICCCEHTLFAFLHSEVEFMSWWRWGHGSVSSCIRCLDLVSSQQSSWCCTVAPVNWWRTWMSKVQMRAVTGLFWSGWICGLIDTSGRLRLGSGGGRWCSWQPASLWRCWKCSLHVIIYRCSQNVPAAFDPASVWANRKVVWIYKWFMKRHNSLRLRGKFSSSPSHFCETATPEAENFFIWNENIFVSHKNTFLIEFSPVGFSHLLAFK